MENYIKSVEHDGDMVIIRRRSGYTKMPLKRYLMPVRTGKLKQLLRIGDSHIPYNSYAEILNKSKGALYHFVKYI